MSVVAFDDVQETTISTGTGDLVLAGAVASYRTFASVCADQDQFSYSIRDPQGGTNFESGIGRYNTGANSVTRLEVTASSNANALVNFTAGTKTIYITVLAKQVRALGAYPITSGCLFRWNSLLARTDLTALGYASKIYDISGNANHATNNTTNPPKWAHNAVNARFPGIFFNFGQHLVIPGIPQVGSPLAATIVFVGQNFQASGNSHIYNWAGSPIGFGSATPLDFMYNGTLPAAHPMSGESINAKYTNDTYFGYPIIGIHVYNGAASIQSLNNNNVTVSPGTAATGTTGSFTLGGDSGSASYMKGIVSEFAVFNFAFSVAQIAAMLQYLKNFFEIVTP